MFSITDAGLVVGLPILLAIAWMVPERHWRAIARTLGPLAVSSLGRDVPSIIETIRRTLGALPLAGSARAILHGLAGERILTVLQALRSYRLDRPDPAVRIAGLRYVEEALQSGRGAVLWVAHSLHADLGAKAAFHRAGLRVAHLSTAEHGFSSTRFGMRYLNRFQTAAEDRHIALRILLPLDGPNGALHVAVRRLRDNGIVSITAHRGVNRPVEAPFLDRRLLLAPGGPALAYMTKATLLPVFAFRDETGIVDVTIEPPIETGGASRDEAATLAIRRYAAILEPYVLRYPAQWLGWLNL